MPVCMSCSLLCALIPSCHASCFRYNWTSIPCLLSRTPQAITLWSSKLHCYARLSPRLFSSLPSYLQVVLLLRNTCGRRPCCCQLLLLPAQHCSRQQVITPLPEQRGEYAVALRRNQRGVIHEIPIKSLCIQIKVIIYRGVVGLELSKAGLRPFAVGPETRKRVCAEESRYILLNSRVCLLELRPPAVALRHGGRCVISCRRKRRNQLTGSVGESYCLYLPCPTCNPKQISNCKFNPCTEKRNKWNICTLWRPMFEVIFEESVCERLCLGVSSSGLLLSAQVSEEGTLSI